MKFFSILLISLLGMATDASPKHNKGSNPLLNTNLAYEEPCNNVNTAFSAGEVVEYKLYYNWGFIWIPAGEVRFSVEETAEDYIFEAIGNTYASYNWIFSLHDTFTSVINKQTMLPKYSSRKIHEGNYHLQEKVSYDHDLGLAKVESTKKQNPTKYKSYEISNCIQDVLSSIYFLRNTNVPNLIQNKNLQFNMFLESQEYNLNLTYRGKAKSKIPTDGEKVHTLHLCPQVLSGNVFKEDDEMNVWVSDDPNHLPISIESPIAVGSIKAMLLSYKGLRYPLNKVK